MTKLIVANWKMNGSLLTIRDYATDLEKHLEHPLKGTKIVVAPPSPFLMFMDGRLAGTGVDLAAQDCSSKIEKGAFTGEVSATMLKEVGCQYVIIGHSERRHFFGDSNVICAQKLQAALKAKLIPIFCVGETLDEKEAGSTQEVLLTQLEVGLEQVPEKTHIVIAYEPVWSIGTGRIPTFEGIEATCQYIHSYSCQRSLVTHILYGGSVNGDNANQILNLKGVDGVLVGGASLALSTFWPIVTAA
jgi:triosephosphate isomerase